MRVIATPSEGFDGCVTTRKWSAAHWLVGPNKELGNSKLKSNKNKPNTYQKQAILVASVHLVHKIDDEDDDGIQDKEKRSKRRNHIVREKFT